MIDHDIAETKNQTLISLSGDYTKDSSAIAGVLPPLYLIIKSNCFVFQIIIIIIHIYIAHYSHCALMRFLKNSFTLTKYT